MSNENPCLVRDVLYDEIALPTDGIWKFPNADGYLEQLQDVAPEIVGQKVGIFEGRIRRKLAFVQGKWVDA